MLYHRSQEIKVNGATGGNFCRYLTADAIIIDGLPRIRVSFRMYGTGKVEPTEGRPERWVTCFSWT